MAKRIGNRELQEEVQRHAMANLETSTWWTMNDDELTAIAQHVRSNRRINDDAADQIEEVLRRRSLNESPQRRRERGVIMFQFCTEYRYAYHDRDLNEIGPLCWDCIQPTIDAGEYHNEDCCGGATGFICTGCGKDVYEPFTRLISIPLPPNRDPDATYCLRTDMSGWDLMSAATRQEQQP